MESIWESRLGKSSVVYYWFWGDYIRLFETMVLSALAFDQ